MPKEFRTEYYLLEGMLDGGLDFVGSYLNKKVGHVVIITDAVGKVHYPDMSGTSSKVDDVFIDIPDEFSESIFYHPTNKRLYYIIQHNAKSIAYVIVENISPEVTSQTTTVLAQSQLALKYHFSLRNKKMDDFGQSMWEHFFLTAGASIPDKLKLYEQNMDVNNYYFVSILEVEEGSPDLDLNLLRSYLYETMHRNRSEYISSIIAPGRLVTILRGEPKGGPMDIDPDWPGREMADATKESIENKFSINISLGMGRVYLPSGLFKSYQEANIALALPRLMGKKQFIQSFSQLGVFTALFSLDTETLRNYCLQVLGRVIEHDEKHGTDFLATLRILLDNACSWTTTANQMYVHVNTVYYRMFKVEQLLNVDFSLFETRLHLFTAIRAWDTLQICKLLD